MPNVICNVSGPVVLDCPDFTRVGGIRRMWIFNIETTAGSVTTTEVGNVISAFTFPTYGGLLRIQGPDNAFSAGYTGEVAEGGNRLFNFEVLIKTFLLSTGTNITILNELIAAKVGAVVENGNEEFHSYFPSNGLRATEFTQNTGQTDNSDTTDNITLTGGSRTAPKLFDDGISFASTLALLESYEL